MVHVIRLRGPWQYERLTEGQRTAGVVQMPGDLASLRASPAALSLSRRFHRPTGLEAGEAVWLGIEPAEVVERAALNGEPLPLEPADTARAEITALLRVENILTLDIRTDGGLLGQPLNVWLEIERPVLE